MKTRAIASVFLIGILAPDARAELTGAGGGPFVGPFGIRSTDKTGTSGPDYSPRGISLGAGAMGYAEFESLRVGVFGIGAVGGEDQTRHRSSLGMGGLTLDMLLRPAGRAFVLPLGIVLGAGSYSVKDMSMSGMTGGRYDYADGDSWDRADTLYETPFFTTGPRLGFSKEVIPWLRIEASATFLAMFRDDGTSYTFMLTIGPTFGKFDLDRPAPPGCEHDYPGCGGPDRYPGPPPAAGAETED